MTEGGIFLPPARLGVVGGGQLGRMFVQAAQRMGYRTVVLSTSRESPAAAIAHQVIDGPPDDSHALRALADATDAITVEFENVSAPGLRWLGQHVPVRPGWRSIHIAQNRIREKSFLAEHGFPIANWKPIRNLQDLDAVPRTTGPLILKTAASGYDGKGQIRVERADGLSEAWERLGRVPCVVEAVVEFAAEVSCVVARGVDGATAPYPVFWNRHQRHILDSTVAPAPIGPFATSEASRLAAEVATRLEHVGLLTVEFFLSSDGGLLINELAPRPHNSGHLTIEATPTSQFEQQVRALCGLPLGPTHLRSPAAMVNLLGDLWTDGQPGWDAALRLDSGIAVHLYGKTSARPGRKMGHLTVLDPDPDSALARALTARRALVRGPVLTDSH